MSSGPTEISEILQAFDPSPTALLDLLRARVDDAMLQEIAEADWGNDSDQHLAPLRRTRDSGEIPPIDWYPLEVLGLTKLSHPENTHLRPRSRCRREHLKRAFACAVLIRVGVDPQDHGNPLETDDTQIPLILSAWALGPESIQAAAQLLAWRIARFPEGDWERLPFELGLLLLLAAKQPELSRQPHSRLDSLARLADWIIAEVPRLEAMFQDTEPGESLLEDGLYFSLNANTWRRLIRENLLESPWTRPEALQKKLMDVGKLVVGSETMQEHE